MFSDVFKLIAVVGCVSSVASGAVAAEHRCAADAKKQAVKLLAFHYNDADGLKGRVGFDDPTVVAPMKNPTAPKQQFDVLEVVGYVNPHGQYRMRFIYYVMPGSCVLMGQEILERAKL